MVYSARMITVLPRARLAGRPIFARAQCTAAVLHVPQAPVQPHHGINPRLPARPEAYANGTATAGFKQRAAGGVQALPYVVMYSVMAVKPGPRGHSRVWTDGGEKIRAAAPAVPAGRQLQNVGRWPAVLNQQPGFNRAVDAAGQQQAAARPGHIQHAG